MEFKGTKGEWYIKEPTTRTFKERTEIWVHGDIDNTFEVLHNETNITETKANAKLIAAAPDLLKALQELSSAVEFLESVDTRTSRANIEARKAIDKALND